MKSEVYNQDCLEAMKATPDNFYSLAIVDPPYGGGDIAKFTPKAKGSGRQQVHADTLWNIVPSSEYFLELFRVSENQIIWGANHFPQFLPSSRGWIFWDKLYEHTHNFSAGELAFSSFDRILRMVRICQRWIPGTPLNIHPTQKPVALYTWILQNYAKAGDTILDTHLGSGSSRIAAYDLGFDFTGYELDKDYFEAQEQRFADHIKQPKLFVPQIAELSQAAMF